MAAANGPRARWKVIRAEYIWVDGSVPTKKLRSKTRVLPEGAPLPEWNFDGSSTNQADGSKSDCVLRPVFTCSDPIRGKGSLLVLCEVFSSDGSVHPSNTRAGLREAVERHGHTEPWVGIEQEYVMFRGVRPLGWPEGGYPAPQGPFYCGVGADEVYGRQVAEEHLQACIDAGLKIYGINAEVMPGQWEFQIGTGTPLEVADMLLVARWLLYRIGEPHGISMSLDPKPVKGDWNGSGAHTNFSTRAMREPGGLKAIHAACERLGARREVHIANYGFGIEQRLTGRHETCSYQEFRYGTSDRGASIRIPLNVAEAGFGYLEDRRPCANIDPYVACRLLLETICGG